MNRNNERRFSQIPKMAVSRSKFNRKQDVKFTMDAGKLVPFYVDEVLPGDTFSVDTAGICRMSTPIYPVMDNCYLDVYYFYTPMRIVWEHAKEFFGENNTDAWTQKTEYTIPQIEIKTGEQTKDIPQENSILDYMGIPTKIGQKKNLKINALPIRGYVKIWQEWFRDQNIDNPAVLKKGDETVVYSRYTENQTKDKTLEYAESGSLPLWVNKFHDYFTSALPSPQKGEPTLIPMSGNAPIQVYTDKNLTSKMELSGSAQWTVPWDLAETIYGNGEKFTKVYDYKFTNPNSQKPENKGYIGADLQGIQGATINNLRQAFAVQQFMEADARGGTRYNFVKTFLEY